KIEQPLVILGGDLLHSPAEASLLRISGTARRIRLRALGIGTRSLKGLGRVGNLGIAVAEECVRSAADKDNGARRKNKSAKNSNPKPDHGYTPIVSNRRKT